MVSRLIPAALTIRGERSSTALDTRPGRLPDYCRKSSFGIPTRHFAVFFEQKNTSL